jgi:hypothetical protein
MAGTRILKMAMILGLLVGGTVTSTTLLFAQRGRTLSIYIPSKVDLGVKPDASQPPQIGTVKLNVSVSSGAPIAFTVTDPTGKSLSFPPLDPTKTQQTLTFSSGDTVFAQPRIDKNSPYRYEIDFILRSDSQSDCTGAQANPQNVYTVAVRPTDPAIVSVCLDSYDGRYERKKHPFNVCSNAALGANQIPFGDPADPVASFDPNKQPTQSCSSFPIADSRGRGILQANPLTHVLDRRRP